MTDEIISINYIDGYKKKHPALARIDAVGKISFMVVMKEIANAIKYADYPLVGAGIAYASILFAQKRFYDRSQRLARYRSQVEKELSDG